MKDLVQAVSRISAKICQIKVSKIMITEANIVTHTLFKHILSHLAVVLHSRDPQRVNHFRRSREGREWVQRLKCVNMSHFPTRIYAFFAMFFITTNVSMM